MPRQAIFLSDNSWHDLGLGTITLNPVPNAPNGLSCIAGDGQATVSWSAPAYTGGTALLDYTVTAAPGGASVTTTDTTVVVSGLTNGTAYSFTVMARNATGSSAASAASSPVTPQAAVAGSGATYYVSPAGSNSNAGSSLAPWSSFTYALAQLRPGDTLLARGGLYTEDVHYPATTNGTAGSGRILVKNYPGERPIIKGYLHLDGISYWTLDGINVLWNSATGTDTTHMVKLGTGESWHLTNAEIWGANSYACLHINNNPTNFLVDYCYIHDNLGPHGTSNQDHCIYADPDPTGHGVITRNILTNSPYGRGVKIALPDPADTALTGNITVGYNTIYNNGGPSNVQLSYTASNNSIYRNILQRPRSTTTTNITLNNVTGSGSVSHDNVGYESAGVMPASSAALLDAGGNFMANPQLVSIATADNHAWNVLSALDWHPQNTAVQAYGRYAP